MPSLANLFATTVCRAELGRGHARLHAEIDAECRAIAAGDKAGQAWSREHGYKGVNILCLVNKARRNRISLSFNDRQA